MPRSPALSRLLVLIVALGLPAALAGLLWKGAPPPSLEVVSVRGDLVLLYGEGVYRYNPLMLGAGFPAQDAVLIVTLGVLAWGGFLRRRGRAEGSVVLLAALGYLWYVYASMSLGAALDWLFPVYVALFSASTFALWLAARDALGEIDPARMPGRGLVAFLLIAGAATFAIWAPSLLADLVAGRTPERLDTQTTKVTHALDLGLIVPLCVVAALGVRGGRAMGHVIALPLLGCLVGLFPWLVLATVLQVRAGVSFSPPEIVGPIAGFAILGLGAAWLLASAWRAMARGRGRVQRARESVAPF